MSKSKGLTLQTCPHCGRTHIVVAYLMDTPKKFDDKIFTHKTQCPTTKLVIYSGGDYVSTKIH